MTSNSSCALVAGCNPLLAEGIRGLLQPSFDAVVMVADRPSLVEAAHRLQPGLALIEIGLGHGNLGEMIRRLRSGCPGLRVIVLGMHDEPCVAESAFRAGADGFVVTRRIATELLAAVAEVTRVGAGAGQEPAAAVKNAREAS